jgi:hypothetical protein
MNRGNGPTDEDSKVIDMQAWRAQREELEEQKSSEPLDLSQLSASEQRIAEWAEKNFKIADENSESLNHVLHQIQSAIDGLVDQLNKEFQRQAAAINKKVGRSDTNELGKRFDGLRKRLIPFAKDVDAKFKVMQKNFKSLKGQLNTQLDKAFRDNNRAIERLEARIKNLEARRPVARREHHA